MLQARPCRSSSLPWTRGSSQAIWRPSSTCTRSWKIRTVTRWPINRGGTEYTTRRTSIVLVRRTLSCSMS